MTSPLMVFAVALFAAVSSVNAQKPTSEVWPELDVSYQPAEHQRTWLELSASSEREGTKREGSVGLYQDYLMLPRGYLRAGYRFTFSTRDASYRESRLVTEGVVAAYRSSFLRVLSRTRLELRDVNGEFSYRLRERFHIQHTPLLQLGRAWAPYATAEAYYDSRYRTIAKIGGRVGTEFRIKGPVSIDLYLARQNNSRTQPKYVNALGITTKLTY